MEFSVLISLVGLVTGLLGSALWYVVVVVGRFVRLESDVATLMAFFRGLQQKMVELMIRADTPELDELLQKWKDREATEEELKRLLYTVKMQHIQAIRREEKINDDPIHKMAISIFLSGIETEYEKIKRSREYAHLTRWQRTVDYLKKVL